MGVLQRILRLITNRSLHQSLWPPPIKVLAPCIHCTPTSHMVGSTFVRRKFHSMHLVVFQYNHYIYPSQHNKFKIVLQHVSAIQPSSGILFLITP
jgi:hypothetical protein